jgi:hypothetical protein
MAVATETLVCPLCGGMIDAAGKECPNCHATSQWQDYAAVFHHLGLRRRNGGHGNL